LVLVTALDHPEVSPRDWACVQTGLFNWSGNLTLVEQTWGIATTSSGGGDRNGS